MNKHSILVISLSFLFFPFFSFSGIQLNNNKFIYIENTKNERIEIKNTSDKEYFIQSIVTQSNIDNKEPAPFIISPPLFKLGANETFFLDIIKIDDINVKEKESLYKINIKSVPIIKNKEEKENLLHVSLNMIYNLFYRPSKLSNKEKNYSNIVFSKNKNGYLIIKNPTPYYITLTSVKNNNINFIENSKIISPFKEYNTKIKLSPSSTINYSIKNEFENIIEMPSKEVIYEE